MKIAVIGNTAINGGTAVAADLSLCGHEVTFAAWPGGEAVLSDIADRGGLVLTGVVAEALSGRGGLARPRLCRDAGDAVAGVDLVVLDVAAPEFEERFAWLLPRLDPDQHVHINMHGYWPALRLAPLLRRAGREDITLSETMAPSHGAEYAPGEVVLQCVRGAIPTAVFPASRATAAFATLSQVFPNLVPAENVLETGFAGLNMMIHFPLVLGNIGWCDRVGEEGGTVPLYLTGMTRHGSNLVAGMDLERLAVCRAWGVRGRPLHEHLAHLYGASGDDALTAVTTSRYYRELAPYPAAAWQRWMAWDIPNAYVPFLTLAGIAGVDVPLHRGAIDICTALLCTDFHSSGVGPERMELSGLSPDAVRAYVETGVR